MKINELIYLQDDIDSINTSEANCDKVYIYENKLIIPYINLDIINGSIVGNENRIRIEFAYLFLSEICLIDWIGENSNKTRIVGRKQISNNCANKRTDWFAINRPSDGYEIKVKFNSAELFIPKDSEYGDEWWTPIDTPNFPKNINHELLEDFLNLKLIPDKIQKIIGINEHRVIDFEFYKGNSHAIKNVETEWILK